MIKSLHTSLPLPANMRQIDGLQVLRAIAVLLVAWVHSGQSLFVYSGRILPSFGIFGIDIFFVISGFIVSSVVMRVGQPPGSGAMWEFFKRRVIRIFPIYWVFALITIIRLAHGHVLFSHRFVSPLFLLPGMAYPDIPLLVDFSWTMFFEMFFYYTLAAVLLVTVRRAMPVAITLLCGAVVVGAVVGIQRPVWIIVGNPILLEFVLGAVLAVLYRRFGKRKAVGVAMVLIGIATAVVLVVFAPGVAMSGQQVLQNFQVMGRVATWGVSATMIVGGVVFWSPAVDSRAGRFAVVLGNASYSAYLGSSLVIEFSTKLLVKVSGSAFHLLGGKLAVCETAEVVAVFCVGLACYQFIEWPMLRWLQAKFLTKKA